MTDQQNVIMQGIVVIANTLMLVGVIRLVRSGAAGDSRLAKIGLRIAVLASALLFPFEVLAGYWLWKSRKQGGVLGLVLFPAGMLLWIGYALPIMVVIGPLRVLLLAWGWKTLR